MLYWIIKPFVLIFYNIFYKVGYTGNREIPYGKPLILAPNHVNGFVDPIIVGMLVKQKVRFFARGDVFKGRFAKWILNALSISPMYRMQEGGFAEVRKNDKTFEECRKLLSKNKTILLFPEAICVQERRLRPLKKGLARIAFQTEETFSFSKDVLIVPIGLNYSEPKRFRSKIFLDIGEAVSVKEYAEKYKADKVKTINEFTKMFEQKMSEHLVIINKSGNDNLMLNLEEMYLKEWIRKRNGDVNNLEHHYNASRELAQLVNKTEEENPELIISLHEKTIAYIQLLNENKLRDHLLNPENIGKMSIKSFMRDYFIIYFGMPFYILGLIFNYPPYYISKRISVKKAKQAEFFASVYLNLSMILWTLFFTLELIAVALLFHNRLIFFLFLIISPLLGIYVLKFHRAMKKIFGRLRLLRMVRKQKTTVECLVSQRNEIIKEIEKLKP